MVFLAGVPQDSAHAPAAVVDSLAQRISPALPVLSQGKTTGAQCDDGARTRTCSLKRMHTFLCASGTETVVDPALAPRWRHLVFLLDGMDAPILVVCACRRSREWLWAQVSMA